MPRELMMPNELLMRRLSDALNTKIPPAATAVTIEIKAGQPIIITVSFNPVDDGASDAH